VISFRICTIHEHGDILFHMNNKNYYIYIYFDPRINPHEPIYVGKGKGKRYLKHLTNSHNLQLASKIKHIEDLQLQVIIEKPYENLSCDEALELEKQLIKKYGRKDLGLGTLCNYTDGGEGTEGRQCKPETRELFSKQRKGKSQTEAQYVANCARTVSEETRKKQSEANKGHSRHTPEQIAAIISSNQSREISDSTRMLWSSQRTGFKQSEEHIANTQASIARGRYLKAAFENNSISPEELKEYNIRLEKRKKRNKVS